MICRRFISPLLLGALLGLAAADVSAQVKIKMATLVPDGSVWHKQLEDMSTEWKTRTNDRVRLVIYPGGVAGDEADVVRKMRIGQIQAAAVTWTGLIEIDPSFRLFKVPLFFESYDELYAVLHALEPVLKAKLEARGFVLVNWSYGGWVYYFSKKPFQTVDDLRRMKIFVWSGEEGSLSVWQQFGFRPVTLAATDIMTGLETGLIDVVPNTPLGMLSLQWFRTAPFMLDLPFGALAGAHIMTRDTWDKLSEKDRAVILDSGRQFEKRILSRIPEQDSASIEEMKKRGLKVVNPDPAALREFRALAADFAAAIAEKNVPKDMYQLALKHRTAYRERTAEGVKRSGGPAPSPSPSGG